MPESTTFNRGQLYELVWSEPISKIGPKYGVSDVAIAKICKKLDVPRPPRGYWARLAHGKRVRKSPLPKLKKGGLTSYELSPPSYACKPLSQPKREIPSINVKERITRYHPVVAELRLILAKGYKDKYHRICTRPSTRIIVSKKTLPRACRILDALIRELEQRGFEATIEERGLTVWVEQEDIQIELMEPAKRIEPMTVNKWGYRHWDYEPAGNLTLSLWTYYMRDHQTTWSDTKTKRLEDRLGKVVAMFEDAPAVIRAKNEEVRQEELARRRRQLRQRRLSDVIKFTHERASQVDQLIEDLEKARAVRVWIKEVEESDCPPTATIRLARWAGKYADHLDPLVDFRLINLDTKIKTKKSWWS